MPLSLATAFLGLGGQGVITGVLSPPDPAHVSIVDIGFALFPQHWGREYAFEAASAVMSYGKTALGLRRVVAVASPDNDVSIRLVGKLGMSFERMVRLSDDGCGLCLLAWSAAS